MSQRNQVAVAWPTTVAGAAALDAGDVYLDRNLSVRTGLIVRLL